MWGHIHFYGLGLLSLPWGLFGGRFLEIQLAKIRLRLHTPLENCGSERSNDGTKGAFPGEAVDDNG